MRLVYVAGPLRAASKREVDANIARAAHVALEVYRSGCLPVVPHLLTRWVEILSITLEDEQFLMAGLIDLMRTCDEVWLMDGWERSEGTWDEVYAALAAEIPIYVYSTKERLYGYRVQEIQRELRTGEDAA